MNCPICDHKKEIVIDLDDDQIYELCPNCDQEKL